MRYGLRWMRFLARIDMLTTTTRPIRCQYEDFMRPSKLKHFFPGVFKSVWAGLDALVQSGDLISTREVWNEIGRGEVDPHTSRWLKDRKQIFTTPTADELRFVAQTLQVPHFQWLIGEKQRLMSQLAIRYL